IGFGVTRGQGTADVPLLVGLGGEFVGFGLGFGLEKVHRGTPSDAVEASILAGTSALAAETGALFVRNAELGDPPRGALTGLSLAAGLGIGHLVGPHVAPGHAAAWSATGAGLGFAAGMLAPIGDLPRSTLPVATAAAGASIGAVLAGPLELPTDLFFGATAGAVFGGGLGGGAGLVLVPDQPDVARGLALGGMLGGFGVGAVISRLDPDPVDDRDVAITIATTAWAAWDTVALGEVLDPTGDRGPGIAILATAAAGGASTALNLALDIPVPHTLSASSIGLWGGYYGAAVGDLAGLPPLALALPLSNVGWIGGAVLVSPIVATPPLVIGIADAGGVLGASLAATGAGLATRDADVVVTASIGGATLGLAAGAILGTRWHRSDTRRDVALGGLHLPPLELGIAPGPQTDGATGLTVTVSGW
ncbi:MAG: hypothetical protein ABMB14_19765, partial [Myxococcota bacterium]